MPNSDDPMLRKFRFGREKDDPPDVGTLVEILEGDILHPPAGLEVDAVVSTDDNYLTMGSGVSGLLREHTAADPEAGGDPAYIREAQAECPVEASTVVVTAAYALSDEDRLGENLKYVLHGTVIDYDHELGRAVKCDLVERTTANCLLKAEELGLSRLLLPAFATGSGQIGKAECARHMCRAIKSYLAVDRPVHRIHIILHSGDPPEENRAFVREANLCFGVPYDPQRDRQQIRDFYGRKRIMKDLEAIVTGETLKNGQKCHAVILGGPCIGKTTILDQLYHETQKKDSPLCQGRRLVRLNFGAVHRNTPKTFVYRKFYHALSEDARQHDLKDAAGKPLVETLAELYADPSKTNKKAFLEFLKHNESHYPELIFLINKLPRLLKGEAEAGKDDTNIIHFWDDLDALQARVRFVYTARPDEEYGKLKENRLTKQATEFLAQLEEFPMSCIDEEGRQGWIQALFERYLDGQHEAASWVDEFLNREAGRHPYLLSLAGHALVSRLKPEQIDHPETALDKLEPQKRALVLDDVLKEIEEPRRRFFAELIKFLRNDDRWADGYREELTALAKILAVEEDQQSLIPALRLGDPNAVTELQELIGEGTSRHQLHEDILQDLANTGILIDTESAASATFMAKSFAAYVMRTLVGRGDPSDQPEAVSISVFAVGRGRMRTVFRGRGARVLTADKRLLPRDKDRFLEHYRQFLDHRLRRAGGMKTEQPAGQEARELVFENAEQISNFILSQFTSLDIKRYLQNAPRRSTVLFIVDEAHTDMPWELMLEATYAGQIPFRVGRTVVSKQAPQYVRPPLRGIRKIRPLLIGNPSGDLVAAAEEVQELAKIFAECPALFEEPKVLTTEEQCHSVRLLSALSSGQYDLVHYAGHARHMGSDSAWQASDGEITTDRLTNALEMAPPALAFVSACESAEGAAGGSGQYEGQSFDLPGAFLQAGVEVYIGALWRVDSANSCDFARAFYGEFVTGKQELGECMRRAKWERKQAEDGGLDWLSFVLYGDPRLTPGDLFPIMANPEQQVP